MKSKLLATMLLLASGSARVTWAQAPAEGEIDAVEVVHTTAVVEKLDVEKRKATLRMENGESKNIKVDQRVRNLDQVKVGDHLKLSYTEEIAIVVSNDGKQAQASSSSQVNLAPKGAKPAAMVFDTASVTGVVLSVDAKNHKVALREADGKKRTLTVSKKIQNLDRLKAGESVSILINEALAVEIVK